MKPTMAQRRMPNNLLHGRPIGVHLRTESEHGGASVTIRAMTIRGWIAWDHELTEAGRKLAEELEGR